MRMVLPALLVLLLAAASSAAEPALGTIDDSKSTELNSEITQVTPIYANGSFLGSWQLAATGCKTCNARDVLQRRNASTASFSVVVKEWGLVKFQSLTSYPADSVLDFWVRGSGITSISLSVMDSTANTLSQEGRFTSPETMKGVAKVLGNDDDGFIHVQLDLAALTAQKGTGASASACKSSTVPRFDQVLIKDISGMGFNLVLDDIKLIPAGQVAASASLIMPVSKVVPVLGDDLTALKSGRNRYVMKLRDNATFSDIQHICQELAGYVTTERRFAGICNTPPAKLKASNMQGSSGSKSDLGWKLLSVTVDKAADLQAMRKVLGPTVEYLEADLTAFTTTRALHDALTYGSGFDIAAAEIQSIKPEDQVDVLPSNPSTMSDADRPSWLDDGPTGLQTDIIVSPRAQMGVSELYASIQSVASWGLDRIDELSGLDAHYSSGDFDGRGVHIYVLDTGVRTSHYDFRGRVAEGASAVGSSAQDDNGHGTHVAGIALGATHGVAPNAVLHPVKVMGADGSGAYSNIVSGLQWVRDHKARNNIASAVVSMSLAGPRSAALNNAIDATSRAGILVVAAAGNNKGGDSCSMSPCSASTVVTVGASTDADAVASFSNIGRCLSVFAPGEYITSASWKGDTAESIMSGTSMATPHVAGAAALYLQYRPAAPAAEVKSALQKAAVSKYFESNSPQLLLNVMSRRLRDAAPKTTASAPPVAAAPAPQPAQATPAPTQASQPGRTSVPSVGSPFSTKLPSSICATCTWCMFC